MEIPKGPHQDYSPFEKGPILRFKVSLRECKVYVGGICGYGLEVQPK